MWASSETLTKRGAARTGWNGREAGHVCHVTVGDTPPRHAAPRVRVLFSSRPRESQETSGYQNVLDSAARATKYLARVPRQGPD